MRLSGTKANSTNQYRGLGDQLYDLGGARPTLDLNFANNESLVDSVTGKNLVTHTRASSATYVDGDGNIQTAVTNYFEDSEGFNASSSFGKGAFKGTVTDNAATAPDESTTATLLVEDTQSGGRYITNNHNFVANTTYTVSCWAKQYSNTGTQDRYFGFVFTSGAFSVNQVVAFNLTGDGSFVVNNGTGTASIEAYPDGWYRCSLTATATVTANKGVQFRLTNNPNNGTQSYTGDGVSGIYIWGAQLEESSTVGEYVKTTGTINSAPRFDHDPVTGESLGLLVEEARTNLLNYSVANIGNGWQNNSGQLPVNLSLNKLGVFNGVRVKSNGQTWQGIKLDVTGGLPQLVAGTTYTITDWWMVGDVDPSNKFRSTIKLNASSGTSAVEKTSSSSDPLDVNSYTIFSSATHGTISNLQVEDAGSDVIKLSYNFVPVNSGAHSHGVSPFSTTAGESVIMLGSQIEEGTFPTSYIPTSGSTVTRATDVASISGNDFGTFNLLQYSEEFNDVAWSSQNASVISNATTAPNGAVTADKIVASGGNGEHNAFQSFAVVSGQTYTFSCYLKAAERTIYSLSFRVASLWPDSSNQIIDFDLVDGTTSISSGTPTSTIVYAGNGWYRCSITSTAIASGTGQARVQSVFDADGEGVLVWGAQLEESSTATPYVKSDVTFTSRASTATYHDYNGVIQTAAVDEARNVAFLPDGNGNFVSAGELLLEDAGTNLVDYSEDFSNWFNNNNNTTITVNAATAPDGTNTADKLIPNTDNASHRLFKGVASTTGTISTFSVYAKAAEFDKFTLLMGTGGFGVSVEALFDLTNGTSTIITSGTNTTSSITNVGNGWYRCVLSSEATDNANPQHQIRLADESGNQTFSGDDVKGLFTWGAQVEHSPYPTSYIPTSGATATRAADVSSSSSNTFGNSFYDQTEGTVFANQTSLSTVPQNFATVFQFNDTTVTNSLYVRRRANFSDWAASGESNMFMLRLISQPSVLSVAYKTNDSAFAAEGALTSDSTCTIDPNKVELVIGSNTGDSGYLNGTIRRLTYWPTRLSNDTLQTITK